MPTEINPLRSPKDPYDLPPSDPAKRSAAADEWSMKLREHFARMDVDEEYRQELAKRIR